MAKKPGIVTLHGKEYKTVALRVKEFRERHGIDDGWSITTELIKCSHEEVVVKASISHQGGPPVSTGYAQETWEGSHINKTSAVEVGETSAVGRALAFAEWAGDELCSADELARALVQQRAGKTNQPPKSKQGKRDLSPEVQEVVDAVASAKEADGKFTLESQEVVIRAAFALQNKTNTMDGCGELLQNFLKCESARWGDPALQVLFIRELRKESEHRHLGKKRCDKLLADIDQAISQLESKDVF